MSNKQNKNNKIRLPEGIVNKSYLFLFLFLTILYLYKLIMINNSEINKANTIYVNISDFVFITFIISFDLVNKKASKLGIKIMSISSLFYIIFFIAKNLIENNKIIILIIIVFFILNSFSLCIKKI